MTNALEQQIALEKEMLDAGVERYNKITQTAEQAGRASETTYAQRLLPSLVIDLADAIEAFKTPTNTAHRLATAIPLLRAIDSNQAAFITLKVVFDSLIKGMALTNTAVSLGQRIEDQIRFSRFEEQNASYYKSIIEDFKRKGTVSYRHKHRVLVKKANDHEDKWRPWTPPERVQVGVRLLELCILATGIIEKAHRREGPMKTVLYVVPTEDAVDWINDHITHSELLHPEVAPCLIQPMPWTGLNAGGYFTPGIRKRVPFIKTRSKLHRDIIKGSDFSIPMKAVNNLQKTAWNINTKVHDVMKEVWRQNLRIGMPPSEKLEIPACPIAKGVVPADLNDVDLEYFRAWKRDAALAHTLERERIAQSIQLSRVFSMADKYRQVAKFYYVYTCDFRGRIYAASPGLSPQGADFSKGLLHFHEGKALGKDGAYWLAVQGANVYGYDKATYDDRVQWVKDHEEEILAVAKAPLNSEARSIWAGADKPYQFLAFCFEWAEYLAVGNSFKSRLAVALDGSCNGLQNFSAMLRDSVGGAATNLTASEKPQDIYQRVADVCIKRLEVDDNELAAVWLEIGISRKLAKKPVMTLPYGSTKQSCRDWIELQLRELKAFDMDGRMNFKAAIYLSTLLWDSIGDVVIAARAAMTWLQKCSRIISKSNEAIDWYTPTGFHVYQGSMKMKTTRVKTQLCGEIKLHLASETSTIDSYKQANGVAPNFVHSMDAAHLTATTCLCSDVGITQLAMIHDSYGTYACDTPELARMLRVAFLDMYQYNDVLTGWKERQEKLCDVELPPVPESGDLDLTEVLDAKYFFG